MSALISRRSVLCGLAATGSPYIFSENCFAQTSAEAERLRRGIATTSTAQDDAARLKQGVLKVAGQIGGNSDLVQEWIDNSEIVKTARTADIHGRYSNSLAFRSEEPLELTTPFEIDTAYGYVGVNEHLWMSSRKRTPRSDLNIAEMTALITDASYIGLKESRYSKGDLIPIAVPFPIGPREAPNLYDYLEFDVVRLFPDHQANHGSGIRPLQYTRHFTMGFRSKQSKKLIPQHVVGYGYLRPDGDLGLFYQLRWT